MTTQPETVRADAREVLDLLHDLAAALVAGSYEGTLVTEEELRRVACVYGHQVEATVLAESATIAVDGKVRIVTHAAAIPQLAQVSALKKWFARIECGTPPPIAEAHRQLLEIAQRPERFGRWARLLGMVLFSVGFGLSIQPTGQEVVVSALLGVLVGLIVDRSTRSPRFGPVAPLTASVVVAAVVLLASKYHLVQGGTIDLMIPVLFVFIPGDAITMAVVELSAGRVTAGGARLAQSLVALGVLAFGPVVAAAALGLSNSHVFDSGVAPTLGPYAGWVGWAIFLVGVMLVFGMEPGDLPWAMAVGLGTFAAQTLAVHAFGNVPGTYIAATLMTMACIVLSRGVGRPPHYVMFLGAFFILTPGSHGLRGLESWIGGQEVQGINDVASMVSLMAAIAFGVLTAAAITPLTGKRVSA